MIPKIENNILKPLSIDYILSRGTHHVLYKDDKVLVSIPLDYYASKWLAYNTQWCTFSKFGFDHWNKTHHLLRVVFADGSRFKCNILRTDKLKHDYSIWYSSWHLRRFSKGLIGNGLLECEDDFENHITMVKDIETLFNRLPEFALERIHEFQLKSDFV